MAGEYVEEYMFLAYYFENQKAGTQNQRDKFTETLFSDYDAEIRTRATNAGVPVTKDSRSMMAALARLSPGNSTATQAGNGVALYQKFLGV
jgi:hypothetical protein